MRLAHVFHLCSRLCMHRIDPIALSMHLEVALTCAPASTLDALRNVDAMKRRRATMALAEFLADRLGCFEISAPELGDRMPRLFVDHAVGGAGDGQ